MKGDNHKTEICLNKETLETFNTNIIQVVLFEIMTCLRDTSKLNNSQLLLF